MTSEDLSTAVEDLATISSRLARAAVTFVISTLGRSGTAGASSESYE
jgi:hypothetical protein